VFKRESTWVTGVSYLFTSKQGGSRIVHSGALHDQRDNRPPSDRRKGSWNAPLAQPIPEVAEVGGRTHELRGAHGCMRSGNPKRS